LTKNEKAGQTKQKGFKITKMPITLIVNIVSYAKLVIHLLPFTALAIH